MVHLFLSPSAWRQKYEFSLSLILSFAFCSVIDLIRKQEFLQDHPSLLVSAELNLLTYRSQPVMRDSSHKY